MPVEFTNPAYIDPGLAGDVSAFLATAAADATAKVAAETVVRVAADAALASGKAPVTSPAFTGNAAFEGLTEGVANLGNSTGTRTLSIATATSLETTLIGNCAFAMPPLAAGKSFVLDILTGVGGFAPTFTGVTWVGGVVPAFPTTASTRITIGFRTNAAGTVWLGSKDGAGGGATPTRSASPPADTTALWFDTTSGILSVWYVDAWVAFSGQGKQGEDANPITVRLITPTEGWSGSLSPNVNQTIYFTPAVALTNIALSFSTAANVFVGMTVIVVSSQTIANLGYISGYNTFVGSGTTACSANVPRSFQCVSKSGLYATWLCL